MGKTKPKAIPRNVHGGKRRCSDLSKAFPGTRQLRFRAALAGARLARVMASGFSDASFVAEAFQLDRLDFYSSDCAESAAEKLAAAATRALDAVKAYLAARQEWFDHTSRHMAQAHSTFKPRKLARQRASVRHGREERVA